MNVFIGRKDHAPESKLASTFAEGEGRRTKAGGSGKSGTPATRSCMRSSSLTGSHTLPQDRLVPRETWIQHCCDREIREASSARVSGGGNDPEDQPAFHAVQAEASRLSAIPEKELPESVPRWPVRER